MIMLAVPHDVCKDKIAGSSAVDLLAPLSST